VCALFTSIFVNRHAETTAPSGGPPFFEGGLGRTLFYNCCVPRTMVCCDYGPQHLGADELRDRSE
jgi:hypothetical protein